MRFATPDLFLAVPSPRRGRSHRHPAQSGSAGCRRVGRGLQGSESRVRKRGVRGVGRGKRSCRPSPGAQAQSPAPLSAPAPPTSPCPASLQTVAWGAPCVWNYRTRRPRTTVKPRRSGHPGARTSKRGGGRAGRAEGRRQRERAPPPPGARASRASPGAEHDARPEGCTCGGAAGGRRQGGWLSRVEARRAPIPAACSRRGLQRAHRSHRRPLGFIYADGRARPGHRNTEAFSCFLTARPSRRTSCGRGIHVPGPARGSLSTLPAAGTAVNLADEPPL